MGLAAWKGVRVVREGGARAGRPQPTITGLPKPTITTGLGGAKQIEANGKTSSRSAESATWRRASREKPVAAAVPAAAAAPGAAVANQRPCQSQSSSAGTPAKGSLTRS